jgi:antitoxin (DNA-binding transcriptional repressor) of toxin-antitoxin stability system
LTKACNKLNYNIKLNIIEIDQASSMKTVSMLQFRKAADRILEQVRRGERFVLTYRGHPVARLEPIVVETAYAADPFYRLGELADKTGKALSNRDIDRAIYGA